MGWREAEPGYEDAVTGRRTLSRTFAESAARYPHRNAQAYKGGVYDRSLVPVAYPAAQGGRFGRLDYTEMHAVVRRLAAGFRSLGIGPDDRVGIFANTRMEWAQCDFALLAAGAVVTTVYPNATSSTVESFLGDADATAVVVEGADALDRVLATDLDLNPIVSIDRLPADRRERAGVIGLREVYERGEAAFDADDYERWLDARAPDDLASLIYTSGTTGRPKGVRLTHWNFKANLDQCRRRFGPRPDKGGPVIDETSRVVSFLPLAHVFERLAGHFLLFASGALVAYAENSTTLQEDFGAIRPTSGTSVPRVYEHIYERIRDEAAGSGLGERVFRWAVSTGRAVGRADNPGIGLRAKHRLADALVFSRVRDVFGGNTAFLISGGGSLAPDLCALYHGMGLPILEGYGLTETAPVVSANPPEAPKIGTIGPPVPDLEVRITESVVDQADFPETRGGVGELLVAGPNVTDGYWRNPEATETAFTDGWFRTGDIVERGSDGYLTFLERRKELLVLSTGKNVAPSPIENAFAASEFVEQIMAVGDGRKYVGALVVPDFDRVRRWATGQGFELPETRAEICHDDRVRERFGREIDRVNDRVEPHEDIAAYHLVPEAFTEENGLLTPTLKKKRRAIAATYSDEISAMYGS